MDTGTDSFGATGARNANASDTPVQPPTHPANSTVSSPTSNLSAPPQTPAPTPLSAPIGTPPRMPLGTPLAADPMHPIQTVGTGKGDLRVGRGERKRLVVIGAIILAAAAFAGLGIFAIMRSSQSGSPTADQTAASFNRYANYLLFNEEKTENPAGEFDLDAEYEIDRQLSSENINERYWDTAKSLLNNAVTRYDNTENLINPDVDTMLKRYQETFNFVYFYRQFGDLTEDEVVALCNTSGSSAAATEVQNFYTRYTNSESQIAKNFGERRLTQYDALIKLYDVYNSMGCIQDGEINETSCPLSSGAEVTVETTTEIDALESTIFEAKIRLDQVVEQMIQRLKSGCWSLSLRLQESPEEISTDEGIAEEDK